MTEEQIKQISQELSDQDLNDLAAGRLNPKTEKVLKYVGIGLASAAVVAAAGVGVAAAVGKFAGKGPFSSLYKPSSADELAALDAEIDRQNQENIAQQKKEHEAAANATLQDAISGDPW